MNTDYVVGNFFLDHITFQLLYSSSKCSNPSTVSLFQKKNPLTIIISVISLILLLLFFCPYCLRRLFCTSGSTGRPRFIFFTIPFCRKGEDENIPSSYGVLLRGKSERQVVKHTNNVQEKM